MSQREGGWGRGEPTQSSSSLICKNLAHFFILNKITFLSCFILFLVLLFFNFPSSVSNHFILILGSKEKRKRIQSWMMMNNVLDLHNEFVVGVGYKKETEYKSKVIVEMVWM
jgi:hypothetical protein